jgi:hypothetical protein
MKSLLSAALALGLTAAAALAQPVDSNANKQNPEAEKIWSLTLLGTNRATSLHFLMTREACERAARSHGATRSSTAGFCVNVETGATRIVD